MEIRLIRDHFNDSPTTGQLYAEDTVYPTLEQPWLDDAPNISCIPNGRYQVILAWSNRFQRIMPRVMNVRGRSGILIHDGSTVANTEGCILVGMAASGNTLLNSKQAFNQFFSWLASMVKTDEVWLNVEVAS